MADSLAALLLTAATTTTTTCNSTCAQLGCGFYEKGCPCACNYACSKHHDCCADYKIACPPHPHPPHPHPPRPPSPPHGGGPSDGPEQLHLSLTQSPTEMVVSFATSSAPPFQGPPFCQVIGGWPVRPNRTFYGGTHTYSADGWKGLLHTVRLIDLLPSTKYTYRCGNGAASTPTPPSRLSDWFGFTSAPKPGTFPLIVAAVGDLGEGCNRSGCGNRTIRKLAADAKEVAVNGQHAPYDLLLHVGDIAYTGGIQTVWDGYLNEMQSITATKPYMVCVGNHEHYHNFSGYINRFAMPSAGSTATEEEEDEMVVMTRGGGATGSPLPFAVNNLFYSFSYGGVHFVSISSEHTPNTSTPNTSTASTSSTSSSFYRQQLAFLEADLSQVDRQITPWVIFSMHRPLYCSSSDWNDCERGAQLFRQELEPMLHRHQVDLTLTGHIHSYERSYPVLKQTTISKSYRHPTAPIHLVIGMAGDIEGLTDSWAPRSPQNAWSAVRIGTELAYGRLHFLSAKEMRFELIAAAGEAEEEVVEVKAGDGGRGRVLDTFTITKG